MLAVTLAACATPSPPISPAQQPVRLRKLVLMLDGVPHEMMDSLWNAGRFSGFLPPSRLISTFPSITGPAFRDIWHEPPAPGYEDRYFDRERSRVAGGLLEHVLNGDDGPGFHRHVDVMADGLTASLAYVVPLTTARQELSGLRRSISRRMVTDSTIVAYIVSTDALAHMAPRDDVIGFLLEIEALLEQVRAVAGPDLEIVVFSDHGNDRVATRRVDLEQALDAAGFVARSRIRDPGDVALPRFGLVGSAFIYTRPGAERAVADALRGMAGVDFVAWNDSSAGVRLTGPAGSAVIDFDASDDAYRYRIIDGDPLLLEPVLRRMQASGVADSSGRAPDAAWLQATLDGPFIDPLRRITLGMRSVRNPANLMVSLAPGYHFGDERADMMVGMAGTHGSLRTSSSLAFAMSNKVRIPDPVRTDALDGFVDLPRRREPPNSAGWPGTRRR